MKYFVIGDEDTVLGFSMVGVEGKAADSPKETERIMRSVLADPDYGIIIITEQRADLIRPLVDQYIFSESFPLIVEIPDRNGRSEGKANIRQMVNQAIGISL